MTYNIKRSDISKTQSFIQEIIYETKYDGAIEIKVEKKIYPKNTQEKQKYRNYVNNKEKFLNKDGSFREYKEKYFKDYSATLKKIFYKISEIKKDLENDNDRFVVITFDDTVQFVDPLFFILLFDLYYEYHFALVIDIRYMEKNSQHYIHRILTQYSDLDEFQIYAPYGKEDNKNQDHIKIYNNIKAIAKSDYKLIEAEFKRNFENSKTIHLFSNVVHKKSLINDSEYEHSLLPILRLRNYILKEIDESEHEYDLDPYDQRIEFYNHLSLQQAENDVAQYRANLHNRIEELLNAVGLGDRNLSNSFRDIFFELIDNIRKHTPSKTNAHISFRKNKISDMYELIVGDNSNKGFLNTYKETLENEKNRLKDQLREDKGEIESFTKDIKLIKQGKIQEILKKLFDIDKTLSTHQIPRIVMHFGIPALLKLLEKIQKYTVKQVKLNIFLHHEDKYWHLEYNFKETENRLRLTKKDNGTQGTYIVISFPGDIKIEKDGDEKSDSKSISLNIKTQDYKSIFRNHNEIQQEISKFKHLPVVEKKLVFPEEFVKNHTKNIIIDYKKYKSEHETASDMIRKIYLFAYRNEIKNIVVINAPTESIKIYLTLLAEIIYHKEYKKARNVLFYDKSYPRAVFIGGLSKSEYYAVNEVLGNYYLYDNCDKKNDASAQIKKFEMLYEVNEKHFILLPFELFKLITYDTNGDEQEEYVDILQSMLTNYLDETKIKENDIHIDTQRGYHIDGYYKFSKVFENSQWVKRLAFLLALKLEEKNNNLYIIGTDKYAGMVTSLVSYYMENKSIKYALLSTLSKKFLGSIKDYINNDTVIYSSVLLEGARIKELFPEVNLKENLFGAIYLKLVSNEGVVQNKHDFKYLISIPISKYYNNTEDSYCSVCKEGKNNKPLYSLSKKDPFLIDNFYEGKYEPKTYSSYTKEEDILPRWINSVYFVHAKRGNNHYTYYTRTIPFFRDNQSSIIKYLKKVRDEKLKIRKKNVILIAPLHNTNNNFVALVNKVVFDNDATIWQFDKTKGEANYHAWGQESISPKEYSFYFVDDEISSGYTLEYFYGLLRSAPNVTTTGNIGFDGIFVLIDRTSAYDENIICNYLRDDSEEDEQRSNDKRKNRFFAYTTLEIKPIKTEVEKCYLCSKQKEYIGLFRHTVLHMNRFQIAPRVIKLNKEKASKVDYDQTCSFENRLTNTIKMLAVDYLHANFDDFKLAQYKSFEDWKKVEDFWRDSVFSVLINEFKFFIDFTWSATGLFSLKDGNRQRINAQNALSQSDERLIGKILRYESKIALIKAMAFPKLSYYKDFMDLSVEMLFNELNIERDKFFNNQYRIENIHDTKKIEALIIKLKHKKEIADYLEKQKNKKNLDYFNFLLITCGYLGGDFILSENYNKLYHKLIVNNPDIKKNLPKLFHAYPFAVKLVTHNNKEKTALFLKNLKKTREALIKEDGGALLKISKSLLDALYLEANAQIIGTGDKISEIIDSGDNLGEKIGNLKKAIQHDMLEDRTMNDIEVASLYVPKNLNSHFDKYKEYLDKTSEELVDIFNGYTKLDRKIELGSHIYELYYGKLTDGTPSDAVRDKVHNTWSNDFINGHTIIRLVSVEDKLMRKNIDPRDNDPIWVKPVGCLVVKHKSTNDKHHHIKVSKKLLAVNADLVKFILNEFSHGAIQEAIQNKDYENIFRTFNHEVAPMFELEDIFMEINERNGKDKDNLIKSLRHYVSFMSSIVKIGRIKKQKDIIRIPYPKPLFNKVEFFLKGDIAHFFEIYEEFMVNTNDKKGIPNIVNNIDDTFMIPIKDSYLKILLYELFFNAYKYGAKGKDITIFTKDNTLYIKNIIEKKENSSTEIGDNIALENLKYLLSEIDWRMEWGIEDSHNSFVVKICEETIK